MLGDSAASAASAASYEPSGSDDEDEGDEEVKVKEGGPSPDQPRPSPPQPAAAGAASGGKGGGVSLYAILGVDPSADAEAIKRAYYRVCVCLIESHRLLPLQPTTNNQKHPTTQNM